MPPALCHEGRAQDFSKPNPNSLETFFCLRSLCRLNWSPTHRVLTCRRYAFSAPVVLASWYSKGPSPSSSPWWRGGRSRDYVDS